MKNLKIDLCRLLAVFGMGIMAAAAADRKPDEHGPAPPDLTQGGKRDESHDWLLGPTGLRGWMFFRHADLTAASRQILITAVDKGSPADGILRVNDVVLGVLGKPFADDARRSFGHAVTAAEEKTGILPLILWRDGKSSNVELKLQVLGAYSATAPYNCPKSKAIFEQGCRLIAAKGFDNTDIPDHLNALALLAGGDKEHHPMLGKYAEKVGKSLQPEDTWNWYIASFFSWMATAAYDEREHGHCGNFWNMLWAIPGAARSGPLATGAYLREQSWYYDLSRNWKGGFVYQKIEAGDENNNYTDWDLTGGYLLSFGLYQKSLRILGKNPSAAPALDAEAVKNVIVAGRDRYPEGEGNGYLKRHDEELIEGLRSWSPAMRHHSAAAIGKRGGDFAATLLALLAGKDRYARYGAVEALGRLGTGAASALPQLRAALKDPDTWLQCLAAEALTRLGDKAAKDSIGDLFAMSLRPTPADPRRMHQRAASRALFSPYPGNSEPRSILADSLDGVDREQLHLVMKSFLQNEDSVVRASIIPALGKLGDRDLALLLPDIVSAIETLAPTNEMWGDDIRLAGLDILSRRHIREGMHLCVSTIEWRWGNDYQKRLEFLKRYGAHAKEVLPQLRKKRPEAPNEAKNIDNAIADIEACKDSPRLVSLKAFIAAASTSKNATNTTNQHP